MSTSEKPRFERVEKLEGKGQFILATDLVGRGSESLGSHGLVTDHIPGERPQWEKEIIRFLRENYPSFRHLHFERPSQKTNHLSKFAETWYGQSGLIFDKTEYYSVYDYAQYQKGEISEGIFNIRDRGIPIVKGDKVVYSPSTHDGVIEIHLDGVEDNPQGFFWRGTVVREGENPGRLVQAVIDWVEQKRVEFDLPLWRDLDWLPADYKLRQRQEAAQNPPLPRV